MSGMRAARDESQADPFAPGRLRGSLENRWDSSVGGLRAEKLEARVQPLEACLALSDRSVAEESASSGIDEARQAAAHAHVRLEALEERHIAALPGGPHGGGTCRGLVAVIQIFWTFWKSSGSL